MPLTKWTDQDLKQMSALGVDPSEADRQLELFKNPPRYISINRPATLGDGMIQLTSQDSQAADLSYQEARRLGRLCKFVPSSGAASRMFFALRLLLDQGKVHSRQLLEPTAGPEAAEALKLMESLSHLAFYDDLGSALKDQGKEITRLLQEGEYGVIWETLLTGAGLGYSQKPKGLIKFHAHGGGGKTPLEEHLIEAVHTVKDDEGICRIHFTVAKNQTAEFEGKLAQVRKSYEDTNRARLEIEFSTQNPALDTLAVDLDNEPFRDSQGKLVFRPAGHGALLENLNQLQGDIVFVKNIDNVAVGRFLEVTVDWKKRLAGFLALIQGELFHHLRALLPAGAPEAVLEAAEKFARNRLGLSLVPGLKEKGASARRESLIAALDRPIRVCGMVPNQGEPGGGPFWVNGTGGQVSLQIVESAQVDIKSPEQQRLFKSSSHFNPVDLVCGVRNWEGKPFDLKKYSDPEAVFISRKSMEGRELKALELPGLWNGAMADWITLFVEVPLETFNPVKTVFDLMKPAHHGRV